MLALRAKISDQSGFALPLAVSILAITALLLVAVVGFATHSNDRATRDRLATRALGAADAGIDAALYRINKGLMAAQVKGVLGVPAAAFAETSCLNVNLGQLTLVTATSGWCPANTGSEEVDGPAGSSEVWTPAGYTYTTSTGINIGPSSLGGNLIQRRIIATGIVDNVPKRVMATVQARLGSSGNLLAVFEQVRFKQCTPTPPNPADPGSGC